MTGKTANALPLPPSAHEDAHHEPSYTISALAKEFGITTRTIRFYESRGLISPERIGTARRYSKRDRARLILILRGRNLGFTVEDVSDYLSLYDSDPGQLAQTRHLLDKVKAAIAEIETKRHDIERSLADLAEIRARCEAHLKKNA
ncbi:MerR family transcriptional regulator [Hyphomicrobium facile]|uniref:DNA-binding transcriptional regulator, MerR family n=1 Tax=Hyphomicrobium facile TaxID=51670 RepID=A0A1I7NWT4_9HYPH|nr:MerR family DNA-binding transcriptional regulator [Hyphomicrobium facile]SFV39093.1 DNA-binding transcriptional regulator, MerR family [Hyphomicrobium facile]